MRIQTLLLNVPTKGRHSWACRALVHGNGSSTERLQCYRANDGALDGPDLADALASGCADDRVHGGPGRGQHRRGLLCRVPGGRCAGRRGGELSAGDVDDDDVGRRDGGRHGFCRRPGAGSAANGRRSPAGRPRPGRRRRDGDHLHGRRAPRRQAAVCAVGGGGTIAGNGLDVCEDRVRRGGHVLVVQRTGERLPRGRRHGAARDRRHGGRDLDPGRLARVYLRFGTDPRPGDRGGGVGRRGLQRGLRGRAGIHARPRRQPDPARA